MKQLTKEILYITPHDCSVFNWDDLIAYIKEANEMPVGNYSLVCTLQKAATKEGLGRVSLTCLMVRPIQTVNKNPNQQELAL